MTGLLAKLSQFWHKMPRAWSESDCGLTIIEAATLLGRFESSPDEFWETT
jgi:hypothetical protein